MTLKFKSDIQFADSMDIESLRSVAEQRPEDFMRRAQSLIDDGKLSWSNVRSLPKFFNSFLDVPVRTVVDKGGEKHAITTSAFPLLSGALTVAAVNDGMESVDTIAGELVTERKTNKKVTMIAGILREDTDIDRVDTDVAGEEYPLLGAGEEQFEIRNWPNGRRLAFTQATIQENDVANIVARCNGLGEIAMEAIEMLSLRRVTDYYGSQSSPTAPYVLNMNKANAALYTTSANSPGTRAPSGTRIENNALVDTTDLDAARSRLTAMVNDLGHSMAIPMSRCVLLVPDALLATALKIQGSTLEPGVENELNNWGQRGRWRPKLLSSPRLDSLSTSAWYLGDFKKQFTRLCKLEIQNDMLGANTESFLTRDVVLQFRTKWDFNVGAVGYNWVTQCLSATTAPADE